MQTLDIRNMILTTTLREQSVTVPDWETANLIIRELDGKSGSELISACTDADGSVNQDAFVSGVILATLRNADDPNKALVFCKDNQPNEYDPAYRDALMATGLGRIMQVAMKSITLSGLNESVKVDAAKNA